MAHFAQDLRKSSAFRDQSRSPIENTNYATATATSFRDVIHSTPQKYQAPLLSEEQEPSEYGSDGSTDMSIEVGRGAKRAVSRSHDMSPRLLLDLGLDSSQIEVARTPVRSAPVQRKPESGLRREAAIRRASEVVKSSNPADKKVMHRPKTRVVSDGNLRHDLSGDFSFDAQEFSQSTATITTRASRFVRQTVSGPSIPKRFTMDGGLDNLEYAPRAAANGNAPNQSGTFTANQSFALPDMANLTELVVGFRKDGQQNNRSTQSRPSRFFSASHDVEHREIKSLSVPDEERRIFASLELANARIVNLEAEKSEMAEQHQKELRKLRNSLDTANRKAERNAVVDEARETHGKDAMDRFERAERKISIMEIAGSRLTRERDSIIQQRDHLITEVAAARYDREQLEVENVALRDTCGKLEDANENLSDQLVALNAEIESLRTRNIDVQQPKARQSGASRKQPKTLQDQVADIAAELTMSSSGRRHEDLTSATRPNTAQPESRVTSEQVTDGNEFDASMTAELADAIEREVQKYRQRAAALASKTPHNSESHRAANPRERTRPLAPKKGAANARNNAKQAPAPTTIEVSDSESVPDQDTTRRSSHSVRNATKTDEPGAHISQENITLLSEIDELDIAAMRRKLEAELRAQHLAAKKALEGESEKQDRLNLPRKSSLKDVTAPIEDLTKASKSVRVQSPHTTETTIHSEPTIDTRDPSISSNISRRRLRRQSEDGMTSAFIIPDITMHTSALPIANHSGIPHNAAECTLCAASSSEPNNPPPKIQIPTPIPVSERDEPTADLTDATLRPSQPPALALAGVIKAFTDELTHLKLDRETYNQAYNQHDPALGKRKRTLLKQRLDALTSLIEQRSDHIYALYDVLEGQQQHQQSSSSQTREVEESLLDAEIDPVAISGHVGRSAPLPGQKSHAAGLDGMLDDLLSGDESDELPWEGLSDVDDAEL